MILDGPLARHALPEPATTHMARIDPPTRSTDNHLAWLARHEASQFERLDRCLAEEAALRDYQALRAKLRWEEDQRLEAEVLGDQLAKRPAAVRAGLSRFRQGVLWLLERWGWLGGHGSWNDAQIERAFDLLGTPKLLREGEPWTLVGLDSPEALVAREVDRLNQRLSVGLDALDAREKAGAEQGRPLSPSKELTRLHRREADCWRRLLMIQKRDERCRNDQISQLTEQIPPPETPATPPPALQAEPLPNDRELDEALLRRIHDLWKAEALEAPAETFPLPLSAPCPSPNRRARRTAPRTARRS